MAIDFTLTPEQKLIQLDARDFAQTMLAPIAQAVDEEPDPLRGFQMMKPAYVEASRRGITWAMLPKKYGGGGLSNVDYIIAAEEIQSVDPGFGTTLLVNGLGLMPIWYYGSEEQKERFIGGGTADTSGEFIVGYAASEPPGSPGGTANFDAPAGGGAGIAVTATLDDNDYVLNGRKYWPCNVATHSIAICARPPCSRSTTRATSACSGGVCTASWRIRDTFRDGQRVHSVHKADGRHRDRARSCAVMTEPWQHRRPCHISRPRLIEPNLWMAAFSAVAA
jgi:hypothetical protein